MEKEFNVYGKIIINVSVDVNASSEEEAIRLAIEDFKDSYNLDVINYHHDKVKYDELYAIEYDES